ncbi:hypothetical protein CO115_00655 [Candidatus Falkowbacteria bacterium CG_4_9_14_3_um_filter_36_9]|uniref:Uncharacterized protein n=2 Tax=Candidatus Falkowiibacteriota TaxID=1752728 RepID=A0A1J4T9S8_9BACT|nr:MAG: hypothetical protein AUJ27_01250 [Candidatus Falkowbacteria bacterium CG1_02_37_44]PIV50281.1 MAG: hypothetical protein COS18_05435 [Candidatus Falkowbacteria bacterium CG02_land_8_20_14_3_00_36_14]PIX11627.1 MAG: hypothetical protein COZ73_02155 [Candidatus Falkowbacteria bacterium CG_4_8_14_3_um_filter_36_11]PJA10464.1 MAG: hypothetical protein COX67_04575 [Candidatus Falkowbacteria bacterium CG_4_10_14_0_2_um_filter_36_22]PJB20736.1 MAG: hypothetical protein CO115_00655 [Candidatus F
MPKSFAETKFFPWLFVLFSIIILALFAYLFSLLAIRPGVKNPEAASERQAYINSKYDTSDPFITKVKNSPNPNR